MYAFRAKREGSTKLVFCNGTGGACSPSGWDGKFQWRSIGDSVLRLTAAQLQALMERLDWRGVHDARETRAPVAAS